MRSGSTPGRPDVRAAAMTGLGVDVSYRMGASVLTTIHAKTDVDSIQPVRPDDRGGGALIVCSDSAGVSLKGKDVGFSHDPGGGAKLVAEFGQVPETEVGKLGVKEPGQALDAGGGSEGDVGDRADLSVDRNLVGLSLSLSF